MANYNGIDWHVVSQELTNPISQTGRGFDDVWEVVYRVDSGPAAGTQATVRISAAMYSAEMVQRTIEGQLSHVHNVASL